MPTAIPGSEISAYLDIVSVAPYPGGPNEADIIVAQNLLVNYEDIYGVICRQLNSYESNNSYLLQALACFTYNQLQAVGIWIYESVSSPPLTDPVLIVNSTYANVNITADADSLCILGSSSTGNIELDAGVTLQELYIGPGSRVYMVNSANVIASPPSSPPTLVDRIYLPFAKSQPSSLDVAAFGSVINQVIVDPGSYYGGIQGYDPNLPCTEMVTSVSATEITKNGVLVAWTVPTNYLFLWIYFRKTGSNVWILATEADGAFQPGDAGFAFMRLQSDTFYDVKISTMCLNGGIAENTITFQTTCCGAGSQMSLYKNCPITMLISSVIDSPPLGQVLCNGVSIDLHYPPGPTITIPYLATVGHSVLQPFVIDNANYQLMPYNPATGTWDASTTPVLAFVEGNVVTVNVSIPA